MLGLFKRKPKAPPPVEWECGSFRHVQILDALEHATDSTVALYRDGALAWSLDVSRPLHEFTCRPVELVINHASEMRLPVYSGEPPSAGNLIAAAAAMAQQQAMPNASPLEQILFRLPNSFADALACKRRWLAGEADQEDLDTAVEKVSDDIQFYWPSNFCLQVNAIQTAAWCVLSALNIEDPWLAAYGCAHTAAFFMSSRSACHTTQCASAVHNKAELTWETATIGDQMFARGVGCPQASNRRIEQQATSTINLVYADWWRRFNEDLASMLIAYAA